MLLLLLCLQELPVLLKRQDRPGPRKEVKNTVFVKTYKNLRISQSCVFTTPPICLKSPGFAAVKEFYSRRAGPRWGGTQLFLEFAHEQEFPASNHLTSNLLIQLGFLCVCERESVSVCLYTSMHRCVSLINIWKEGEYASLQRFSAFSLS